MTDSLQITDIVQNTDWSLACLALDTQPTVSKSKVTTPVAKTAAEKKSSQPSLHYQSLILSLLKKQIVCRHVFFQSFSQT